MLTHVKDQFARQSDTVLWVPPALMLGVVWYFALNAEPSNFLVLCLGLFLVCAGAVIRWLDAWLGYVPILILLGCIGIGFGAAQLRTQRVMTPQLRGEIASVPVAGRVVEQTVATDDAPNVIKLVLDQVVLDGVAMDQTPKRIRLTVRTGMEPDIRPNDLVFVQARLLPPNDAPIPDGFDYRRHAFFEQVGANGFAVRRVELLEKGHVSGLETFFAGLRVRIAERVMAATAYPANTVLVALLTGEQTMIPKGVLQEFRDSGLAHILSVSGLHVAIVCGFVFFVVRLALALSMWLALHWPIKKIAAVVALCVGIFYTLLAGADVPTVRAMIMTGIVLVGVLMDRITVSLRVLALAATFVVVVWPESVLGASFQLSFSAMLALIGFYEGYGRGVVAGVHASILRHMFVYVAGLFLTSILATLATAPFTALAFGRVQIYGVLANALAVPLTSFITMPALFTSLPLLSFPSVSDPILHLAAWSIEGVFDIAHRVATLPAAVWNYPQAPTWVWAAVACGYIFFWLWRGTWKWAGLAVCVAAFAVVPWLPRIDIFAYPSGAAIRMDETATYIGDKLPSKYDRAAMRAAWGLEPETARPKLFKDGVMNGNNATRLSCADTSCVFEKGKLVWRWPQDVNTIRGVVSITLQPRQTAPDIHYSPPMKRPWSE